MRSVLIVKLSSLGDVVHAMPVVHDIRRAHPGISIDWVVEAGYAPMVQKVDGVRHVIECSLRRWRKAWWKGAAREEWRSFRRALAFIEYDAILDLQGLTKSAVVARLARGPRFGLANRTDGSSYERPARWLVDHPIYVEPKIHVVSRSRVLAAEALGYVFTQDTPTFGLQSRADSPSAASVKVVVLVHGTSRTDKLWPEASWVELGRLLVGRGWRVALPHAGRDEHERARRLAAAIGPHACEVWAPIEIGEVVDRLARADGVIGVDSGLSHIAVALALPHVQIYSVPTSWRTGPQSINGPVTQVSVEGRPPSVKAVWDAWCDVVEAVKDRVVV